MVGVFFEHLGKKQSLLGNAKEDIDVPVGGAGLCADGTLELLLAAKISGFAGGWKKGRSNGEEPIGQKYQ